MVAQRKQEQANTNADEQFQRIRREVFNLPTAQLSILLRDISDAISQQETSESLVNGVNLTLLDTTIEGSDYQSLKTQGGPFSDLITLLEKEQLTDAEEHHLRELGHQQAVGLLADWRPAPTDEDVERVLNERVIERYGR